MDKVETENVMDENESEGEQSSIEEKNENTLTDIANLDITSRLSLKTTEIYGESHRNGVSQVNGICNSPERITSIGNNLPQSEPMETSHLNQHGTLEGTLSLETRENNIRYVSYTSVKFTENYCFLFIKAMHGDECVGAIVCKLDIHRKVVKRGYIAMLAVNVKYRKQKIGSNLVRIAIQAMVEDDAGEVVLETEITNRPALRLYENLGFVRDKRLFRYYLNGVDALRLKLWLR
ncbi:N-alpha-acetyltransferase 30 [Eufriesea mexicana]|nr:N-alpha-acetyltransferase 30 [Eufriesea mexicana]